jgi:hypothetical protein
VAAQQVKNEIDAQSGRFEFFKQALTLGLAGLAGTAAFFTDTSKIPEDGWSIAAIIVMGLALLATVAASLMGLSVYANLLKAHSISAAVSGFQASMVRHAQWIFVTIVVVALAFVIYAGLQLANRGESRITSVEALGIARKAIAATGCQGTFETLSYKNGSFTVTFYSQDCHRRYAGQIQSKSGEILLISSVQTP